jgi:hypothetical protein
MPTLSETLASLSESFAELSVRAKQAEDHMTAARDATHDQLEARAAEARKAVQRRREEVKAHGAEVQGELSSHWAKLRAQVQEQLTMMRDKIDEARDDHQAKAAERRAERLELNALDASDFAVYALDEAEAAALEAADARAIADALSLSASKR